MQFHIEINCQFFKFLKYPEKILHVSSRCIPLKNTSKNIVILKTYLCTTNHTDRPKNLAAGPVTVKTPQKRNEPRRRGVWGAFSL